jgi:hypothetical protein
VSNFVEVFHNARASHANTLYSVGNGLNLASAVIIACSGLTLMAWERQDNKRREKIDVDTALAGLSQKEIEDLDWRHPSFRWKY